MRYAPPMSAPAPADRSFLRSARTVSVLTLFSRVLGMLRDVATARLLGAGLVADALTIAWTVPNTFRRLFGEGALSSAFVPVFTRELGTGGRPAARRVLCEVVAGLGALLSVVAVLGALLVFGVGSIPDASWAGWLEPAGVERLRMTLGFVQLLLPYLVVICVVAQITAALNALGEFAVPALVPVVLNVVWLAGVGVATWWGAERESDPSTRVVQGYIVAGSILVAALVQLVWPLRSLARHGTALALLRPRITPAVREVGALMAPMLLGMGAAQLNVMADRGIAWAALPEGGTTHLYYGLRLMQFPLGLVSVAITTAVYPALARLATSQDRAGMTGTASLALRTNLLIALPAGVGLAVLAGPVVELLFLGGAFDAESVALTSRALVGYALGVPAAGTVMLLQRTSYAAGDVRLPVRIGLAMVVVNVALDLVLVGPLGELGLALATTISAVLTAVGLLIGVSGRLGLGRGEKLLGGLLAPLMVGLAMGAAVWGVDAALADSLPTEKLGALLRVGVGMAVGLGVVALLAPRLCPAEWGEVTGLLRRKRSPED